MAWVMLGSVATVRCICCCASNWVSSMAPDKASTSRSSPRRISRRSARNLPNITPMIGGAQVIADAIVGVMFGKLRSERRDIRRGELRDVLALSGAIDDTQLLAPQQIQRTVATDPSITHAIGGGDHLIDSIAGVAGDLAVLHAVGQCAD